MKCSKCKVNERKGSMAYCQTCHSEYVKELRAKKLAKMQQPIKQDVQVIEDLIVKEEPPVTKKEFKQPNPIYWSCYVTKGSELHKRFLEIEKTMVYESVEETLVQASPVESEYLKPKTSSMCMVDECTKLGNKMLYNETYLRVCTIHALDRTLVESLAQSLV